MSGEDIIVGKTVKLPEDPSGAVQRFTKRDASLALRGAESGVIDQVRAWLGLGRVKRGDVTRPWRCAAPRGASSTR